MTRWCDHSWWAKSVRWSCGRPGWVPLFDHEAAYGDAIRAEYARAWTAAQILRADGGGFLKITSVT